jgi:hypothetical protein
VLFGLGVRVLLCMVDAATTSLQGGAGGSIALASVHADQHQSGAPLQALLSEQIACVIQDVAAVLAETQALTADAQSGPNGSFSSQADQPRQPRARQVGDVFDLSYRTSPQMPPARHHPAVAYLPLLGQALAYLQAVAHRFNTALPAQPSAANGAMGFAPAPPALTSPLRRPMSSYSRPTSRVVPGAGPLPARSPSYSPPPSAGGLGPLSPRVGSATASGRARSYKVADTGSAVAVGSDGAITNGSASPRPTPSPPSSSPRSAAAAFAGGVVPRIHDIASPRASSTLVISSPVSSSMSLAAAGQGGAALRPLLDSSTRGLAGSKSARKPTPPTAAPPSSALPLAFSTQQAALDKLERQAAAAGSLSARAYSSKPR